MPDTIPPTRTPPNPAPPSTDPSSFGARAAAAAAAASRAANAAIASASAALADARANRAAKRDAEPARPGAASARPDPAGPRPASVALKPPVTPEERERGRLVGLAAVGCASVIALVVTVGIFLPALGALTSGGIRPVVHTASGQLLLTPTTVGSLPSRSWTWTTVSSETPVRA